MVSQYSYLQYILFEIAQGFRIKIIIVSYGKD